MSILKRVIIAIKQRERSTWGPIQITRQLDGMLSKYRVGLCNIFLQHTSASLTINEVRAITLCQS